MANLKSIKSKIISSKKMGTVTRAMEAVSAVKMRKSQERALSGRAYAAAALSILERLSSSADLSRHPLMQGREGKTALIIVTSDKGLAGSLNSGVIRRAESYMRDHDLDKRDSVVFAFGRKGGDHFASRGYEMGLNKVNVSDDITEPELREITRSLIDRSDIGKVVIVYQNFVSSFEQIPTAHEIVPITAEGMRGIVDGIRPARGKYSPQPTAERMAAPSAYTVEPDADEVLSVLLPKLINVAIFHGLLENKASEHSARMVAMKSATDKAKEMAQAFTRKFNKVRQAAITREVSEITSGIEAMK
jgi:F-type H+-transporting ATPase subunit gamma